MRKGLSPRVRGIRVRTFRALGPRRSIPACTGNPRNVRTPGNQSRVYPRVYGESYVTTAVVVPLAGLSPRVRGIHDAWGARWKVRRSIPACTGNPAARLVRRPAM